jgi:hypothetical protein
MKRKRLEGVRGSMRPRGRDWKEYHEWVEE